MSAKESIPISFANRLINNGPLVLVTSFDGRRPNVLAVAWCMPVNRNPLEVAVSVGRPNYSHDVIEKTSEYVINIPTVDLLDKVIVCGTTTGRTEDKFEKSQLTAVPSTNLKAPLIEECVGHLECRVVHTVSLEDHSIFIGEVVAASADCGMFKECWRMEKGLQFIHHLGARVFSGSKGTLKVRE